MAELSFRFVADPFSLTHELEPNVDAFLLARQVADELLVQFPQGNQIQYFGIPHTTDLASVTLGLVIPSTHVSHFDISVDNHANGSSTKYNLYDRDRSGRVLSIEEAKDSSGDTTHYDIVDSFTDKHSDFPFEIASPSVKPQTSCDIVNEWLYAQLHGIDTAADKTVDPITFRDQAATLSTRSKRAELGGIAINKHGPFVHALKETVATTFGDSNDVHYTVWLNSEMPAALSTDAERITQRAILEFDGEDLLTPKNTMEYTIEGEEVSNIESLVMRSLLQATNQTARTIENLKRLKSMLEQSKFNGFLTSLS